MIPPPGPHGGDGARLAEALGVDPGAILDLSASLNPLAPDAGEVVAKHLDAVGRYPDPAAATSALAAAMEVDPDRLLLTNGGAEAIALVGAEMGGRVDEPDFALYPRGGGGAGPVWRSNPHNPSGRLAGPAEVAGVWDEAFYPLATGRWTRGDAAAVVVGSLTKLFACPGLRVGYVLAPDASFVARLRVRQPAWSLNGLAAAAVPDLLAAAGSDLAGWARDVAMLRVRLVEVLRTAGYDPEPSDANFVLVRAPALRARLGPHGILVRDCASFGLPDHVRIAVPDDAGLSRLTSVLSAT
ncbi:MAG: aminotransferase class I/II-fold pyridoxal phosphate-dependent enzyme [Actinomycetota bacterium]|nr:aminotransferase class I/II-fold pyridoxal phosphate-dependent enzyme [Actinomycetota bacterium]